ncbi:hypothetical protein, partial [Paracidovorax citrulli]|uniref:hypothetical protein n=1 Tax=Paracidovorax citrulli TaxID=80869 RepID=UPI00366E8E6D
MTTTKPVHIHLVQEEAGRAARGLGRCVFSTDTDPGEGNRAGAGRRRPARHHTARRTSQPLAKKIDGKKAGREKEKTSAAMQPARGTEKAAALPAAGRSGACRRPARRQRRARQRRDAR